MKNAEKLNLARVDTLIRQGKVEEALKENDEILLRQGLGLSEQQVLELRRIWTKLRDRRVDRKKNRKTATKKL